MSDEPIDEPMNDPLEPLELWQQLLELLPMNDPTQPLMGARVVDIVADLDVSRMELRGLFFTCEAKGYSLALYSNLNTSSATHVALLPRSFRAVQMAAARGWRPIITQRGEDTDEARSEERRRAREL